MTQLLHFPRPHLPPHNSKSHFNDKTKPLTQFIFCIIITSMTNFDYTYPPSEDKALRHRLASRIFKGAQEQQIQLCQCCSRKIGEEELISQCCVEPTQLSFLGPGAPLFFCFLRYAIGLLAIMVVVFVGFSIISNILSSDCQAANSCIADTFTLLSIINKQSNTFYLSIQSYVSLGFVVVTILFFHLFRYKSRKLEERCDKIINSPSDYAIILRRLPPNTAESDILQAVQNFKMGLVEQGIGQIQKIKVIKVILSYNLRQFDQVKAENQAGFRCAVKQDRLKQFKPRQMKAPSETSKIAIVVFQLQQTKDLFLYKASLCQSILRFFCAACTPLSNLVVKGQRVGVQRAPQPDQIAWGNSGITMLGSICRKMLYGAIALVILLLGGGAQYALQLLSLTTQDVRTKSFLGILSSVLVTIFNAIILITLQITTKKERSETLTEFQTNLMVKTTLAQFFNAGIFVIVAQIAATYQTFTLQSSNIMSQISLIMILDAVIPNATLFFLNYFQIIQKVKRFLILKKFVIASQRQLNELYAGPQIDLPSKYAYILKTLWLTGLYAPMIPIVVVIALIGLLINYFIEKLLFTRCYSMPNTISKMAFQSAVQLLEYFLIAFAAGQFVIYAYFYNYQIDKIPHQWTITIFVTIGLALLNSALPMQAINQKIFTLDGLQKSLLKYSQAQERFGVTYEMSNPAYKTSRKRRQDMGQGFSLTKNKHKNEEVELTNLMMIQSIQNRNTVRQPLLNEIIKRDNIFQQGQDQAKKTSKKQKEKKNQDKQDEGSDFHSISVKSATIIDESEEQRVRNQLQQHENRIKQENREEESRRFKQSQSKRQMKTNFYVETLVPLEDRQIQALQFYLRHQRGNGFKAPKKLNQAQKLRRKQQAKVLKKQRDSYYKAKALKNYNFVDIKNIKGFKKWNYQESKDVIARKQKEPPKQQGINMFKQSVLVMNIGKNPQELTIPSNDNAQPTQAEGMKNKRQKLAEGTSKSKNIPIFTDPAKEEQSIYDPLNVSTNYEDYFNDVEGLKESKEHYLNKKYVMSYLGTPFHSLLNKKTRVSLNTQSRPNKI